MNSVCSFICYLIFFPAISFAGTSVKIVSPKDGIWVYGQGYPQTRVEIQAEKIPKDSVIELLSSTEKEPITLKSDDLKKNYYYGDIPEFGNEKATFTARVLKDDEVLASDSISIYGGAWYQEGLATDYLPGKPSSNTFKKAGSVINGAALEIPADTSKVKTFFALVQERMSKTGLKPDLTPVGPAMHLHYTFEKIKSHQTSDDLTGKIITITVPLDFKVRDNNFEISKPEKKLSDKIRKGKVIIIFEDAYTGKWKELDPSLILDTSNTYLKFKMPLTGSRQINFVPVVKDKIK